MKYRMTLELTFESNTEHPTMSVTKKGDPTDTLERIFDSLPAPGDLRHAVTTFTLAEVS